MIFHDKANHIAQTIDFNKATITNYNLWTITPINLKYVDVEIWAKCIQIICEKLQQAWWIIANKEVSILIV